MQQQTWCSNNAGAVHWTTGTEFGTNRAEWKGESELMKCNLCSMECPDLGPGETFCGECGHAASEHAGSQPIVPPPVPPQPGPFVQSGSYSAEISRQNPGCLIFLVDQSGSMNEPIAGGTKPKKDEVADAVQRLLYNTVLRCTKEDGVRPYFDTGVWTYGGSADVRPAFGTDLLSIREIAERPKRVESRRRRIPDGAGGVYEEEFQLPVWFDPVGSGQTPMSAAFRAVVAPLTSWLSQHQASFPPIIINLTDGAYTDQSPATVVRELAQMATTDGNALVFNCHITQQSGISVSFPSDTQASGLSGLARELYEMSSPLPEPMRRQAQAKGYQVETGARGYVFNADLVTMIDFLDIGTRAIQDRMEKA